jgi:Fe/S biogenesis protein NfuA
MRRKIMKLLESEINPYVHSHGGSIEIEDFVDGIVYIRMSGGCQGCGAAKVTLGQGVERTLREHFGDQIKEVIDLTDHEAGNDPYYAQSK